MKYLNEITYKQTYNKIDDNIANTFYLPSLERCIRYDRLTGYFGSTVFIIAWQALKSFVEIGGKMRIVCSPVLGDDDIDAIQKGSKGKQDSSIRDALNKELDTIWNSDELRKPFQVLAALIANGIIEIKVAVGKSAQFTQLFHDKTGIFFDGQNSVSFRGSVNETFKGLSNNGNIESISVFTSWLNPSDAQRVASDQELFDRIWDNTAKGLIVCPLPEDIKTRIKNSCPKGKWEDLADEIAAKVESLTEWSADSTNARTPRKHQMDALNNWVNNQHNGILEHATGSGKTFTSLCAIRRSISEKKTILILVPSADLLRQWSEEVKETLSDLNPIIALCGDNHSSWRKDGRLKFLTSPYVDRPKITIATMDSAVMPDFLSQICQGDHLFIVADEVHRLGSTNRRKFFAIEAGYKLGVSATPKRYGDPCGTNAILNYFGGIIPPVYSLQNAIKDEVLTPYFYCPKIARLSPEEQEQWNELTKKIRERYAHIKSSNPEGVDDDKQLQHLLMQRARVVKKASSKVELAYNILKENYKPGQKWIVYCEDRTQLNEVLSVLNSKLSIDVLEYYSDMEGDRKATLDFFSKYGGVVVSIRCLDEGVDIPSTTHAIILASSKNPREFIQRRGRVLRRFPGKYFSWLYDAIVLPDDSADSAAVSTDSLICAELSRAIQFAEWSDTSTGTTILRATAAQYGIDINELSKNGFEDE